MVDAATLDAGQIKQDFKSALRNRLHRRACGIEPQPCEQKLLHDFSADIRCWPNWNFLAEKDLRVKLSQS
jgi:hypothetical protein